MAEEENQSAEEKQSEEEAQESVEAQRTGAARPTAEELAANDWTEIGGWSTGTDPGESSEDRWLEGSERTGERPSGLTRDTDISSPFNDLPTGDVRGDSQNITSGEYDPRLGYGFDTGLGDGGGGAGMGRLDPSNADSGNHRDISEMGQGMISDEVAGGSAYMARVNKDGELTGSKPDFGSAGALGRVVESKFGDYTGRPQTGPGAEELAAALKEQDDLGTKTTTHPDGTKVTKSADGSKTVEKGNITTTLRPDGTVIETTTDPETGEKKTETYKPNVGDPGPEGEQDPGSAPNLPEGFGGRGSKGGETINPGAEGNTGSRVVDPNILGAAGQQAERVMVGQPGGPDGSGVGGGGPGAQVPSDPERGGNIDYEEGQPSGDTRRDGIFDLGPTPGSDEVPDPTGSDEEEEGPDLKELNENVQEQVDQARNPQYMAPPTSPYDGAGSDDSGGDAGGGYDFTNLRQGINDASFAPWRGPSGQEGAEEPQQPVEPPVPSDEPPSEEQQQASEEAPTQKPTPVNSEDEATDGGGPDPTAEEGTQTEQQGTSSEEDVIEAGSPGDFVVEEGSPEDTGTTEEESASEEPQDYTSDVSSGQNVPEITMPPADATAAADGPPIYPVPYDLKEDLGLGTAANDPRDYVTPTLPSDTFAPSADNPKLVDPGFVETVGPPPPGSTVPPEPPLATDGDADGDGVIDPVPYDVKEDLGLGTAANDPRDYVTPALTPDLLAATDGGDLSEDPVVREEPPQPSEGEVAYGGPDPTAAAPMAEEEPASEEPQGYPDDPLAPADQYVLGAPTGSSGTGDDGGSDLQGHVENVQGQIDQAQNPQYMAPPDASGFAAPVEAQTWAGYPQDYPAPALPSDQLAGTETQSWGGVPLAPEPLPSEGSGMPAEYPGGGVGGGGGGYDLTNVDRQMDTSYDPTALVDYQEQEEAYNTAEQDTVDDAWGI